MVRSEGSPRDWVRAGIADGTLVVLVVAVALAIPIGFIVGAELFEASVGYLLVLVGVLVPSAYRQLWPRRYGPTRATLWTIGAVAVVTMLYWAGYRAAARFLERPIDVASVAFVFAVVGGFVAYRRARWLREDRE
ncbi:MAG: hypothetical protein ACLFMX_01195 [Halobacteriales archaeon]